MVDLTLNKWLIISLLPIYCIKVWTVQWCFGFWFDFLPSWSNQASVKSKFFMKKKTPKGLILKRVDAYYGQNVSKLSIASFPNENGLLVKELSFCNKLKLYNHYISANGWCKPLIFQTWITYLIKFIVWNI